MALTPVRDKKALPSSKSMPFFERPSCHREWQVALEHIKSRFLKGHWKTCAVRCKQLFHQYPDTPDGLCATYLLFYAAICYESISRSMHDLSETKLTRLHQAREAYDAAAISLPSKQGVLWRQSWSTDAGSVRSGISENSEDMWYGSPTKNRWIERFAISLPYSDRNQRSSARTSNRALKPSPLRIHKHLVRGSLTVTPPRSRPPENEANHGFRQSQIPPLSAKPTDDTNPSTPPRPASPLSVTLLSSTTISPHGQTRLRFDRLLVEFADMLRGHKDAVERLILGVQDSQTSRHVKRLASFSADKEARAADLQRRIVKLRAIGWERERFRPERYQDLCETALAEL